MLQRQGDSNCEQYCFSVQSSQEIKLVLDFDAIEYLGNSFFPLLNITTLDPI